MWAGHCSPPSATTPTLKRAIAREVYQTTETDVITAPIRT